MNQNQQAIVQVPFNGQTISAHDDGDRKYTVAFKPLCENLGVDFNGQYQRLRRQPWAVMCMTHATGSDSKTYDMVMIDRQTLVMWLATIDTSRLKSEKARAVVTTYQKECAKALDDYFFNGIAVNESSDFETVSRALLIVKSQLDRKKQQLAIMAPKAIFADSVANADSLILVRELAHILRQNNVEVGQNRLFEWLRNDGYLEKHRNEPTQRSLDLGVMRVVEHTHTKPDGSTFVTRTPKITGKGQTYFVNRYGNHEEVA